MSYILDALRRSEKERKPSTSPAPPGAVHQISASLPPRAWPLYAGLVLLLGLMFVLSLVWRNLNPEPQKHPALNPPPAVLPATATPEAGRSLTPVQASADTSEMSPHESRGSNKSPVLDLAEQTRVTSVLLKSQSPSTKKTVTSETVAIAPESGVTGTNNHVPFLGQKSTDFQQRLPEMAVTIHVFSPNEAQRILFINNREYHKGDQVSGGPRVDEIVEDGVILSYQGEKFKLSRPH